MTVDCDWTRERLPWLWNGTLTLEERASVRRHLDGCAACRSEKEQTDWFANMLDPHPPPDWLAAHALYLPMDDAARGAVEDHMTGCGACREEWDAARESGLAMPRPSNWRSLPWWLAAAAMLVAGALGIHWRNEAARMTGDHAANLRALERELARTRHPLAGVPAVDLFPRSLVHRSGQGAAPVTPVRGPAVLFLNQPVTGRDRTPVELRRDGAVIWRGEANAAGLTVAVWAPPEYLEPGEYEIVMAGETYRFRAVASPDPVSTNRPQ